MHRSPPLAALAVSATLLLAAHPADAQAWNDAPTRALIGRAVAHRRAERASGLEDFRARAHGFVFFLAQLGEQVLHEPPQLVKSDQLELEVYWRAAGESKQRIVGWRDRADLPTDIQYHRDHLGIVQNGFANRIRLGQGDEVRDVPHPLAPDGGAHYDFAIVDSLVMRLPEREVRAVEVAFRPKRPAEPAIVGSMFLDAGGGELVRIRFNFTPSAYRDASLEDITVLLENALWDGRWWLPRRQEIEIRRRTSWLDLPARGIIRGRWIVDDYAFNVGLDDRVFRGPEIGAVPKAVRDTFPWDGPLDAAIRDATGSGATLEMDAVRARVRELVGGRSLSGLPAAGLAFGSLSDLLHVNRVEGFAPGAGVSLRPGGGVLTGRGWVGYGVADRRVKARARLGLRTGRVTLHARAARVVHDVADDPVVAPVVNSFLAQERGVDFGDYVLIEEVAVGLDVRSVALEIGVERTRSVVTRAVPAAGAFPANPALGAGTLVVARARLGRERRSLGTGAGYALTVRLEGGAGSGTRYARARLDGEVVAAVPGGAFALAGWAGWADNGLPSHRPFLLGGRGSLVGERHRAFGGRSGALLRGEWRIAVPAPALPLGPFVSTGREMTVAPFVAAGIVGRPYAGAPWVRSDGLRPVVGVSVEVFHRLLRAELGWSPRAAHLGFTVDVRRELWPIL